MPIVKRLSPEERVDSTLGPHWKAIVASPLVKSICQPNYFSGIDPSPLSVLAIVEAFNDARWITKEGLNEKVFMYACGIVAQRAGVEGMFPENLTTAIGRHLVTAAAEDKINKSDGIDFGFRQCILWDIPAFLEAYRRPGSYVLPALAAPKRRKIKKPKRIKRRRIK